MAKNNPVTKRYEVWLDSKTPLIAILYPEVGKNFKDMMKDGRTYISDPQGGVYEFGELGDRPLPLFEKIRATFIAFHSGGVVEEINR